MEHGISKWRATNTALGLYLTTPLDRAPLHPGDSIDLSRVARMGGIQQSQQVLLPFSTSFYPLPSLVGIQEAELGRQTEEWKGRKEVPSDRR